MSEKIDNPEGGKNADLKDSRNARGSDDDHQKEIVIRASAKN
jgi:hypothetical protein